MKIFAVIDTNILVSALLSSKNDSATVQVMEKVLQKKFFHLRRIVQALKLKLSAKILAKNIAAPCSARCLSKKHSLNKNTTPPKFLRDVKKFFRLQ